MNTWLYIVLILILQPNDKGREGNKAYDRGDYALAAQLYTEAINKEPENSKLYFNLGNALSKLGKKAEANEAWEKAKTINKNPLDQSKSYYNQGFAASQENDYERAATLYKNALRLNPKDEDAKHNLELVTKKQQQQKQQQQQQQPQQNQQDQQKNQQQQQQQQNQQQQNQQQQNQQQQQQENKQQSPSKPQFDPGSMSKQQAKDMLDALESQEKDLLKNIKKRKASSNKNAKDW